MPNDATETTSSARMIPDYECPTPCYVISEDDVRRNPARTANEIGGIGRLIPHIKTHRAPWIVKMMVDEGVKALKCATPAEIEMTLEAGAKRAIWAYPSVNPANIERVIAAANRRDNVHVSVLIDSAQGLERWVAALGNGSQNVDFLIDLDLGMGRTGVADFNEALGLAKTMHKLGRFSGLHAYDGHVRGDRAGRVKIVTDNAARVGQLQATLRSEGFSATLVAGDSYTFNIWPKNIANFVSPGSWAYSSAMHKRDLGELQWEQAAYVLTTVVSVRNGTATLDAGSKAISPDQPVAQRFHWDRKILLMSEEHTVVESDTLRTGDRILLVHSMPARRPIFTTRLMCEPQTTPGRRGTNSARSGR